MRLAVYPNVSKPEAYAILKRILRYLYSGEHEILLPIEAARHYGIDTYGVPRIEKQPADMAISIGGDGTLLGVCRRYGMRHMPVCGINIGTLGFLADIEPAALEEKLQKILQKEYFLENRLLLSAYVTTEHASKLLGFAINDVVVSKSGVSRMIRLGLQINDTHLADYKADGVIVSTPTGSTAYSLSAGGPIVNPNIDALLVTPICAHSFFMRPMLVSDKDIIHINVDAVNPDIVITFDGQESFRLLPGNRVVVKKSPFTSHIVKFEDTDYYNTIKNKLWKNG